MDHRIDPLLEANNRIARAEMAVMLQIVEIDKLRVAGRGTAMAERVLLAFVKSLEAMRERSPSAIRASSADPHR
jgi:hypothetical protein